ncbi:MAG: hypothetical protein K2O06_10365 [Acetatifactor sp.]|nr:hypothetical protein [Acetatifactor sp.]
MTKLKLFLKSIGYSVKLIYHSSGMLNTTLADRILVIGDGHIVEEGSHDTLLKQNGMYAHLFHLQADKYL